MLKRKKWVTDECPRGCGQTEDSRHVVTCSSGDETWADLMEILSEWFAKNNTAPGIAAAVTAHCTAWRTGDPARPGSLPSAVAEAVKQQDRIGWGAFVEGCTARRWQIVQSDHLRAMGSQQSGRRWAYNLGQHGLPARYGWMFSRSLGETLGQRLELKKQWLSSVVFAKERLRRPLDLFGWRMQNERAALDLWSAGMTRATATEPPKLRTTSRRIPRFTRRICRDEHPDTDDPHDQPTLTISPTGLTADN